MIIFIVILFGGLVYEIESGALSITNTIFFYYLLVIKNEKVVRDENAKSAKPVEAVEAVEDVEKVASVITENGYNCCFAGFVPPNFAA